MYTIIPGFYPFAGILVSGVLYAVCRCTLRLKCHSRWAQAYIAMAMVLTTAFSFFTPASVVTADPTPAPLPAAIESRPAADAAPSAPVAAVGTVAPAAPVASAITAPSESTDRLTAAWSFLLADVWTVARWLYLTGVAVVLLWLMVHLLWLARLRRRYPSTTQGDSRIYTTDLPSPFCFGRSIFLSSTLSGDVRRYVLMHEQAHTRHHHSAKLFLTQATTALCWYNPFAWLFCAEMRLQQELEVDGDVLRQGIDRQQYQLSLLSVCTQEGKWIVMQTAYNLNPLKQRIIFMNTTQDHKRMRRHQMVATACTALTMVAAVIMGCQTHQSPAPTDDSAATRHHPMRGCWTMDWISNTGSGIENHPPAMHYGFYNDSTFLCFSYWGRKGRNISFCMSGEGYSWRGDTLVDAQGHPTDYTFSADGRTVKSRWLKDSLQNAYVQGPDITEQWSRIEPDADIVGVFQAVAQAGQHTEGINGVWTNDDDGIGYFLVNDTTMMVLSWYPSRIAEGFRYGASGTCGTIRHLQGDEYQTEEANMHITLNGNNQLTITGDHFQETLHRVAMPPELARAFSPVLSQSTQNE